MKNLIRFFLLFFILINSAAALGQSNQRGRYFSDEGHPGLPPFELTLTSTLLSLIFFSVYYFILRPGNKGGSKGCTGSIFIIFGAICAIPLIPWLFQIWFIVFILFWVGLALYVIIKRGGLN